MSKGETGTSLYHIKQNYFHWCRKNTLIKWKKMAHKKRNTILSFPNHITKTQSAGHRGPERDRLRSKGLFQVSLSVSLNPGRWPFLSAEPKKRTWMMNCHHVTQALHSLSMKTRKKSKKKNIWAAEYTIFLWLNLWLRIHSDSGLEKGSKSCRPLLFLPFSWLVAGIRKATSNTVPVRGWLECSTNRPLVDASVKCDCHDRLQSLLSLLTTITFTFNKAITIVSDDALYQKNYIGE